MVLSYICVKNAILVIKIVILNNYLEMLKYTHYI